jgi:hypothetical protein
MTIDKIKEYEIMKDFDGDKYIDNFCQRANCGLYDTDEMLNSCPCDNFDDYVKKRYNSILKRRLKKLKENNPIK